MTKQQYILLLSTLLLFIVAIAIDYYAQRTVNLESYVNRIEEYLQNEEGEVLDFFKNKPLIKRLVNQKKETDNSEQNKRDLQYLRELEQERYTILIYKADSLIFWSNNLAINALSDLPNNHHKRNFKLVTLTNGDYEQIEQIQIGRGIGTYTIIALIPLRYQYQLSSHYLQNKFAADEHIPTNIKLSSNVSSYPITNSNGQHIGFLSADGELRDIRWQRQLVLIYLLAFLTLCLFLNSLAKQLTQGPRHWLGAAFLIVSIFGLRSLSIALGFTDRFNDLAIFAKSFDTGLSNSLGDLIINIMLLLWVMVFFHKASPPRSFDHLSPSIKFGLTTLSYFSIFVGILIITKVFKDLVK